MQVLGLEVVGVCKENLNELCVKFCKTVNEHPFGNEQQWTAKLSDFCKTLPFTQNDIPLLFAEIKTILLNPQDPVSVSCNVQFAEILQILRSQMQQVSSDSGFSGQCAVCSGASGSGIWARCVGKRCSALFHVRCAASRLQSRRHSSIFYRCKTCAAREIQSNGEGQQRKRQNISRDDGCTSSSCLDIQPGGAYGSASNVAAEDIQGNGKDDVATSTNDAAAYDQTRRELSIVQGEILSTIQVIHQAAHSKVSLENAALLKRVLFKIRALSSEVKQLLSLASLSGRSHFSISTTASRVEVGIGGENPELVRERDLCPLSSLSPHRSFDSNTISQSASNCHEMEMLLTDVTDNDFSMFSTPLASRCSEPQAAPESLLKFVAQRKNPLPLQGQLNNDHVSDCLSMFAILREDTLFILPMHCFSISHDPAESQKWLCTFTRFVSKHNFNYVVAMLSIEPSGNASQMNHSQETRWVASVGDVAKEKAWHYDPAKTEGQQKQSLLLIRILSAVMTYKTQKEFNFQETECPVKIRCQRPSHSGILSLVCIQNWCTCTLAEYEMYVKNFSPSLMENFAEECNVNLIADLKQGVADSSMMFWPQKNSISSYSNISSFWNITKQMHFAYCLREKFGCDFQEQFYQHGILQELDPNDGIKCVEDGNPRESVHFFTSHDSVVKVYRILLGSSHRASTNNLAKALHEASATAYVCHKCNWRCEVFGIVTQGVHASYLHVCILRTLLNAADLSAEQARGAFILLLTLTVNSKWT